MLSHVGRVRVLEIRHERRGARVERVDHHLPVGGSGDLDAAVLHVERLFSDLPFRIAYLLRGGEEVGHAAGIEIALASGARFEELAAARVEFPRQRLDEASASGVRTRWYSGSLGPRISMFAAYSLTGIQ
jgi:hypothetical protein